MDDWKIAVGVAVVAVAIIGAVVVGVILRKNKPDCSNSEDSDNDLRNPYTIFIDIVNNCMDADNFCSDSQTGDFQLTVTFLAASLALSKSQRTA
jgi:hypothetical protein